ncbi:hypothetical protein [Alteromonas ponticola]|uniref:GGDEF domain-containing protein n=1 Tax=Alteromonas ponticola TaxID=2720613 RepID=A0ABX1R382_9ALTE|nr:hypothetical protein [Alteromonas ponticola]NMH60904.1 hypothetical protein [Alteromonas ponticola]
MEKRQQILEAAGKSGEITLAELDPFDSTTSLGRYFRFSVHSVVNNALSAPLSTHDIAQLEIDFPELYTEHKGLTTYLSHAAETDKIAALETMLTRAESQGWPRLVRWFSALLVELEMKTGNYGHALFRLYEEIDFAPDIGLNDTYFEYPKSLMLRDMAATLYYLGEYEKSLDYCQRFAASLTDTGEGELQGALCEIRAQIRLGQHDVAFASLETLPTDSVYAPYAFTASLLHAEALLESERLKEAKNLGEKAHALLNEKPNPQSDDIFDVSLLLAQIHLKVGHIEEAEKYAGVAEQNIGLLENSKHHMQRLLRIQGEIAEANGNFESAFQLYERLYDVKYETIPSLPWKKIESISSELDNQEIEYLRIKAKQEESRLTILKIILMTAVITTLFSILLYYNAAKNRVIADKYLKIDHLTGVYNHGYISKLVAQRAQSEKTGTIALLNISNFIIDENITNPLAEWSKLIQPMLGKGDIVGRYEGNTFLFWFGKKSQIDAQERLDKIMALAIKGLIGETKTAVVVAKYCDQMNLNQLIIKCAENMEEQLQQSEGNQFS